MKLSLFLKDKLFFILCQSAIILFIGFMFSAFGINIYAILFICTIIAGLTFFLFLRSITEETDIIKICIYHLT